MPRIESSARIFGFRGATNLAHLKPLEVGSASPMRVVPASRSDYNLRGRSSQEFANDR
jgi:hypothetical protein